mmetsp:Transcript_11567/g.32808  ORF Transcript_11567/g.32808 Transcript_11567/m.32808 type:complete len:144 (-) Transcript_11567:207-638(-)
MYTFRLTLAKLPSTSSISTGTWGSLWSSPSRCRSSDLTAALQHNTLDLRMVVVHARRAKAVVEPADEAPLLFNTGRPMYKSRGAKLSLIMRFPLFNPLSTDRERAAATLSVILIAPFAFGIAPAGCVPMPPPSEARTDFLRPT